MDITQSASQGLCVAGNIKNAKEIMKLITRTMAIPRSDNFTYNQKSASRRGITKSRSFSMTNFHSYTTYGMDAMSSCWKKNLWCSIEL
jgi:hypothetical protein